LFPDTLLMRNGRDSDELRREVATMAAELTSLRVAVERLYALLTERPARGGPRRATPTPAQLGELNTRRCLKARIARAARRHGLSVDEWLARFGPVDRLPAGALLPAATAVNTTTGGQSAGSTATPDGLDT
jgi:hypothetical protein